MGCFAVRLALCMMLVSAAAGHADVQWLFKPTGGDGATDYSGLDVDEADWMPVQLPHRTWDEIQPDRNVYGWYRGRFVPDERFRGRGIIFKMGIVDDVDETYCNGVPIGGTGSFPPNVVSAYNVSREYVIPGELIRWGEENVLAVKVFDIMGIGGWLGSPRFGYRLSPADTWLVKPVGPDGETDYSHPDLDDADWETAPMPDEEWNRRQPQDNVYGWYRLRFPVPEEWRDVRLVLDLSLILDVDATYVNGEWIGLTGSFPPEAYSAAGEPRLYELPADCLRFGEENVLAVKVFNDTARGGIWGRPAILAFSEGLGEDTVDHAVRLRHAQYHEDALALLTRLLPEATTDARRAAILDELTVVYEALGRDDEALEAFGRLMREYPYESCSRDAVYAVSRVQDRRGQLSPEALFLGEDRVTRGDWWLNYGNDGFVLGGAAGQGVDIMGTPEAFGLSYPARPPASWEEFTPLPFAPFPFYSFGVSAPGGRHSMWGDGTVIEDRRATYSPLKRGHVQAWWDDLGGRHPFDGKGPDLGVRLQVPEGLWALSAYFVDMDWGRTWHPRQHAVVLTGADHDVRAVADTGKFAGGVWLSFAVTGPADCTLRVCKNRSSSAILSAVCLDRLPESLPDELSGLGPDEADDSPAAREGRRAWAAWNAGPAVPSPRPREGLWRRYVATLEEARPAEEADVLAALEEELLQRRSFGAAREAAREVYRLRTREGVPLEEAIAAATPLMRRWVALDDAFAVEMFRRLLTMAEAEGGADAARLIAQLATPFAEQGAELLPSVVEPDILHILGDLRTMRGLRPPPPTGFHAPVGIPSMSELALEALRKLPEDVVQEHCADFLRQASVARRPAHLRAPVADQPADFPTEVTRLAEGFAPAWSPTGTLIACMERRHDDTPVQKAVLKLVDADTGQGETVGPMMAPSHRAPPVWSPAGDRLVARLATWAERTLDDGRREYFAEDIALYLLSPTGEPPQRLARQEHPQRQPWVWSPCGRFVVYGAAKDGGGEKEVRLRRLDPASLQEGEEPRWIEEPVMWPHTAIWMVDVETGAERQITHEAGVDDTDPTVSPDGEWIAFMSLTSGADRPETRIYRCRTDGSEHMPLVTQGTPFSPRWSPDGTLIAYLASPEMTQELWVMEPSGAEKRKIVGLPRVPLIRDTLTWTTDSRRLVFLAEGDVWGVDLHGGRLARLTNAIAIEYYRDGSFTLSPDAARVAFSRDGHVYIADLNWPE